MGMVYSESMSHTATGPRRHRLTVADYYRMGEAGILAPDARVELIDGEIIDMAPPGDLHAGTVDQLVALLSRGIGDRALLRVQNPISIDGYSEPQPDIALLRPRADYYKTSRPRPQDVWLVIEVADTSLRHDRDEKMPLYARSAIAEAWLVDLVDRQLTRYRNPLRGVFGRVDKPDLGVPLEIGALADVRLDLSTLFP
jgi:Uma2 family endonuclease